MLLIGGIVFVKIDALLHHAINTHGSELLGVEVRIKKINLDIMKGNLQIMGLAVKNPAGFSAGDALYIPKIIVKSKLPNLFRKPAVIDRVSAQSPEINFELKNGANNITALKKAVVNNAAKMDSKASKKQGSVDEGSKFMIRNIDIKDIRLNADLKLINENLELGDISLKGVENDKPVPYQELVQQLLNQLLSRISKKTQLNVNIGGMKINIMQSPKEIKKEIHNELKHYLKGTLDKILPR